MIELSDYRVIDLSPRLVPGEKKLDGTYLHGDVWENRPIELQEFIAYNARMHFVQGQTHIGVHTEAPYKYFDNGKDLSELPVTAFIGEAAVVSLAHKKQGTPLVPDDFVEVRKGDIVLAWAKPLKEGQTYSYITDELVDYLASKRVKMIGLQNLSPLVPGRKPSKPLGVNQPDAELQRRGIAVTDGLINLEKIRKTRVFFVCLPVKIARVTAFWSRAVALEPR